MNITSRSFRATHGILQRALAVAAAVSMAALAGAPAAANPVVAGASKDGPLPAPIAQMLRQGEGVRFQDRFDAPGGLTGYVLSAKNGERRIYYVTPDGAHAILGLMFNAALENETAVHQQTYMSVSEFLEAPAGPRSVRVPQKTAFDAALAARHGLVEGKGWDLFVVFDLLSPLSRSLHKRLQAESGKLRVHWHPVAINDERSLSVIQAWLSTSQADRARALASMMRPGFEVSAVAPVSAASPLTKETQEAIADSVAILKAAGAQNAPALVYRDATGSVRVSVVKQAGDISGAVRRVVEAAAQAAPR